jgi:hypothetical protein
MDIIAHFLKIGYAESKKRPVRGKPYISLFIYKNHTPHDFYMYAGHTSTRYSSDIKYHILANKSTGASIDFS